MKLLWKVIIALFLLITAKVGMDSYKILKTAAGGEHIRIDPALYFNLSYLIFGAIGLMILSDVFKKYIKENNEYKQV
ncbi:hypothetical protein ACWE42_23095 [Sutcliffiella cohnii]|uniref:Uncharacterized protein n=1 Tax=Sutcliffiella cohnii TaxID=33932 RepID=A0A223KM44_9BACI|nr:MULTISPECIES: hypothetical protein [Sutcliffiella]AST90424.1 hypothetical protein BC6307_03620 [Sutcliffiella cohnii]MED4017459.1 hypothetical protein [Sutcliffiella cohnii]WBL16079.1 hypothetical protein O1A01_05440 [Sutcliffiella sp. NC1]